MQRNLKRVVFAIAIVTVGYLSISFPVFAHHGTAISYDRSKAMTLKGTVTEFHYANPHPQLYVDVKDDSGRVTNWGCEIAANLYQLSLSGWSNKKSTEALKAGTPVTIQIAPSRAGTKAALLMKVTNAKGEELLNAGAE